MNLPGYTITINLLVKTSSLRFPIGPSVIFFICQMEDLVLTFVLGKWILMKELVLDKNKAKQHENLHSSLLLVAPPSIPGKHRTPTAATRCYFTCSSLVHSKSASNWSPYVLVSFYSLLPFINIFFPVATTEKMIRFTNSK